MGRSLILLLLASLAVATATSASTLHQEGTPKVKLLDPAPVTLRGVGFAQFESVRLAVRLGTLKTKRVVRATRSGTFTARFPALRYDRCSGELAVTAVGSRGSRVSWELVSLECPDLDG